MDILGDILGTLDLKGALYFRTDFSPPWGVTVPSLQQAARFHLVIQGECHVNVQGGEQFKLGPGDLVLIPNGASHILSDKPLSKAPPLEKVLQQHNYQGEGTLSVGTGNPEASTQMVCGHYTFRQYAEHPIIQALPSHLVTTNSCRAKHPLLDNVLRLVSQIIFTDKAGSEAAITRLSEVIFIELLRSGIGHQPALQSIMDAFHDPKISRSLKLIHHHHSEPWTVESLASEVAMSRSRFANRFSELLGTGPMAYLANWRLQKSLALLDNARLSVQQIAEQSGYQSPSAFTRAFSGKFGTSPRDYRRLG